MTLDIIASLPCYLSWTYPSMSLSRSHVPTTCPKPFAPQFATAWCKSSQLAAVVLALLLDRPLLWELCLHECAGPAQVATDASAPEAQSIFHDISANQQKVKSEPRRGLTIVTMKSNPDTDPGTVDQEKQNNRKLPALLKTQSISHYVGTSCE